MMRIFFSLSVVCACFFFTQPSYKTTLRRWQVTLYPPCINAQFGLWFVHPFFILGSMPFFPFTYLLFYSQVGHPLTLPLPLSCPQISPAHIMTSQQCSFVGRLSEKKASTYYSLFETIDKLVTQIGHIRKCSSLSLSLTHTHSHTHYLYSFLNLNCILVKSHSHEMSL